MPDRDILGETVQRTVRTMSRLRNRMRERIPYGPLRANLSSREARLMVQELDAGTKLEMMKRMGSEEWENLMDRLYKRGSSFN